MMLQPAQLWSSSCHHGAFGAKVSQIRRESLLQSFADLGFIVYDRNALSVDTFEPNLLPSFVGLHPCWCIAKGIARCFGVYEPCQWSHIAVLDDDHYEPGQRTVTETYSWTDLPTGSTWSSYHQKSSGPMGSCFRLWAMTMGPGFLSKSLPQAWNKQIWPESNFQAEPQIRNRWSTRIIIRRVTPMGYHDVNHEVRISIHHNLAIGSICILFILWECHCAVMSEKHRHHLDQTVNITVDQNHDSKQNIQSIII